MRLSKLFSTWALNFEISQTPFPFVFFAIAQMFWDQLCSWRKTSSKSLDKFLCSLVLCLTILIIFISFICFYVIVFYIILWGESFSVQDCLLLGLIWVSDVLNLQSVMHSSDKIRALDQKTKKVNPEFAWVCAQPLQAGAFYSPGHVHLPCDPGKSHSWFEVSFIRPRASVQTPNSILPFKAETVHSPRKYLTLDSAWY